MNYCCRCVRVCVCIMCAMRENGALHENVYFVEGNFYFSDESWEFLFSAVIAGHDKKLAVNIALRIVDVGFDVYFHATIGLGSKTNYYVFLFLYIGISCVNQTNN